ncbi:MAG: PadR family transcriptional regulator [Planctomycetota bacterium]
MARSEKANLLQGTLDMLILRSLQSGKKHGYQITRWLDTTSENAILVEEGSLYPALHRMERRGWIESDWGRSESNRRAKFYKLTASGRSQLKKEITEWESLSSAISLILTTRGVGLEP